MSKSKHQPLFILNDCISADFFAGEMIAFVFLSVILTDIELINERVQHQVFILFGRNRYRILNHVFADFTLKVNRSLTVF